VVWQRGREIAAWGEPERADLTFSVAKTYLALLAGVAHGRGLLPDPNEPIIERIGGIGFESEHNRPITWAHMLEQTSEWEGECFGIPDTVDRYRVVAHDPRSAAGRKGEARPLQTPGTYWEYNDVRINQLSLALLRLFGEPLPEVFREAILRPIGAGGGFQWQGYDDAWVDLPHAAGATRRVQSVPGGSHWGGGVSISARDQARIAQLLLDGGRHGDSQLIPESWVERLREPSSIAPFYGWLTWLNGNGVTFPGASKQSSFMIGAGGHYVWIEPKHHAVVVVRWLDPQQATDFTQQIAQALSPLG
jgi:CubicO group peptidase (beta-lactamase class C family)